MVLDDEIFEKKLNELIKHIYASNDEKDISTEVDNLYSFITKKWKGLDFFKKFDQIVNSVFIQRVLKEKNYTDGFLKKYLNIYFDLLKSDFYSCWGLIFAKILMTKNLGVYPSVFPYLFRLQYPKLPRNTIDNDLLFPLEDDFSLYDTINLWLPVIEEQVEYSSSYSLFINTKLRNELVLHLYKKYKTVKKLSVWFPFGGIGIEPLLFVYIFMLVAEADTGNPELSGFHVIAGDHFTDITEKGISSGLFDDILIKVRDDFCLENGLKSGDLKTSIKNAKRKLVFHEADLIYKTEIPDKNIDTVIINSLKLSDNATALNKLKKVTNIFNSIKEDMEIIYEIKTPGLPSSGEIEIPNAKTANAISSDFISYKNDYHITFLSFIPESDAVKIPDNNNDTFESIYLSRNDLSSDELKKKISGIVMKQPVIPGEMLKYAEILAIAGNYSKSYDIVKKFFKHGYTKSYEILELTLSGSKNQKLNARIEKFIIDNKLKEKGFSGELLDAITEEIDEFLGRNPGFKKNKERWLI